MAAGTAEGDPDRVGRRGDGAGAQPDRPDVQGRVTVHGHDGGHRLEYAGVDHVQRTARHGLLGRLEHEPDGSRQRMGPGEFGERQPHPEHDGRVDVVAAGMADAGNGRAVGDVLHVQHGQRVDVGTYHDHRDVRPIRCGARPRSAGGRRGRRGRRGRSSRRVPADRADVTPQARPGRQRMRRQAGGRQAGRDGTGRPVFLPAQFRMRMKITSERDELAFMLVQPAGDRLGGVRHHVGRPACARCPRSRRAPARMT